jgi:hypothetical protein
MMRFAPWNHRRPQKVTQRLMMHVDRPQRKKFVVVVGIILLLPNGWQECFICFACHAPAS